MTSKSQDEAAWDSWRQWVAVANESGLGYMAAQYRPMSGADQEAVDRSITRLIAALLGRPPAPEHDERLPLAAAGESGQDSRTTQR